MEAQHVGQALKDYFKKEKKTQAEVSKALGMTQPYVNTMLKKPALSKRQSKRWHQVFGFDTKWLMTGMGDMIKEKVVDKKEEVKTEEVKRDIEPTYAHLLNLLHLQAEQLSRSQMQVDRLLALLEVWSAPANDGSRETSPEEVEE